MSREVALFGVYLPAWLFLGTGCAVLTAILSRSMQRVGAYRFLACRPLVDLSAFVLLLCLSVHLTTPVGQP